MNIHQDLQQVGGWTPIETVNTLVEPNPDDIPECWFAQWMLGFTEAHSVKCAIGLLHILGIVDTFLQRR